MRKYNHIELTLNGGIALLTFNRPDQLNAMNREMMDEIIDALEIITADKQIRLGVITGKGSAFMAGADIKEYALQTPEQFNSFVQKGRRLYRLIEEADIPFIAAVNGYALGGGFEIALACDFIVAGEKASIGLPEIRLGLIPGGGGTYRLYRKIGLNRLKEVLMLGQPYTAAEMHHWGVVHKVTDEGAVMEYTMQLADKLRRRSAASMAVLKRMFRPDEMEKAFSEQIKLEGESVLKLFYGQESQQLIKAFIEKNK
jgi:enoyl-CoA hydratase/carnithine racemase